MSTGVAKTGVGDVAKAAGVAHGTFYVHFENKDAVVREVGPSFISIYDTQWNEIDTIQFNDGGYAFRVMLDTQDDDIYVAYDEMDLYAWQEFSISKLEHYRILTGD